MFILVIWLLHPWLGVLALLGAVLLFALALGSEIVMRAPLGEANERWLAAQRRGETALRNAEVVHAMGMLPALLRRWHADNDRVLDQQAQAGDRGAAIVGMAKFLRLFLQIGVLGLGAYLVLRGELTGGGMIAGSILLGRALAPVEQAIGAWKGLVGARASHDRLQALLRRQRPAAPAVRLPVPEGRVSVERLVFAPPGGDRPILKQVEFELAAGEVLAVIGPSGSGKSTLCRLIVGIWPPTSGHVRLDGAEVHTWDRGDFGRHVGYLPQDVELFAGTVRDNIARMSEAPDEAVIEAARLAGAHDMILRLRGGYGAEIGAHGAVLSGGQRQWIGLARAMFGQPRLVVLDEPNASLDQAGEAALIDAIGRLKAQGTTVILVAHRPSLLVHVDKLLVLREGAGVLFGPREEVLPRLIGSGRRPRSPRWHRDRARRRPLEHRRLGSQRPAGATRPLMHELRRQVRAGALLIGLFFGGLGWWAASAPLAGAAIAPGVVSPEGSRRTVQHLEGGIVRDILVRDGSVVRAGEPLILLEDVQARAGFDVLQARFYTLAATQARLLAEQSGATGVRFPDWLIEATTAQPAALEAMVAQRAMFDARAKALADRKGILRQRIEQLREEIAGLEAQIGADGRQIALIDEEIEGVEQLYRKGLERKARLLALQRTRAEIDGNRAERRARIAQAQQAIGEAELQILAQDTAQLEAVNEEASRIQSEFAEVEQRVAASRDVLERTVIAAPVDGTVVALRMRTPGGVIRPGEPVLEIVPAKEELLIDARVSPMDIDVLRPGLPARVVLPAFQQRNLPQIMGRVRQVAADATADPQTGKLFFEVRIEIDPGQLAALRASARADPGHAGRGLHHDRRADRPRLPARPVLRQPAPRVPRDLSRRERCQSNAPEPVQGARSPVRAARREPLRQSALARIDAGGERETRQVLGRDDYRDSNAARPVRHRATRSTARPIVPGGADARGKRPPVNAPRRRRWRTQLVQNPQFSTRSGILGPARNYNHVKERNAR